MRITGNKKRKIDCATINVGADAWIGDDLYVDDNCTISGNLSVAGTIYLMDRLPHLRYTSLQVQALVISGITWIRPAKHGVQQEASY